MKNTIQIVQNGSTYNLPTAAGESILSIIRTCPSISFQAPCGGTGKCKRCMVEATGTFNSVEGEHETITVNLEQIPACRYSPIGDCTVVLPNSTDMTIATSAVAITPNGKGGLGLAVDIGTTTVASFLYDLKTGHILDVQSGRNAQKAYGADVISRIQYCSSPEKLSLLSGKIREQISELLDISLKKSGKNRTEVCKVSIAGNTVMEHIFAGLDPTGIGVAPFSTVSLFGNEYPASDYISGLSPDASLRIAPAVAAYVGGDITAGLLAAELKNKPELSLFLDIGTNGEMAIGNSDGFLTCATAAGPAFEGAEIECGMDGSTGAISKVSLDSAGNIMCKVIGDCEATGLCGSGLIDAIAVMLECGAIDETGRMEDPDDAPGAISSRIRYDDDEKLRFYLTEKVWVSAADVRKIQLAKAAIRAGIETLLHETKHTYSDINKLYIAGGFGAYLDKKSACAIGLLPPALLNKTVHIGNSAGVGASLALTDGSWNSLLAVRKSCKYLELSSSAEFMEHYIDCMMFDEE